jgi:hypothetical protein
MKVYIVSCPCEGDYFSDFEGYEWRKVFKDEAKALEYIKGKVNWIIEKTEVE